MTGNGCARGTLLLVGNPHPVHVGAHLARAAGELRLRVLFRDVRDAFAASRGIAKLSWWLRGHRPARLRSFSAGVVRACEKARPGWLLSTGLAPLDAAALEAIGKMGVRRLNYLTDDPWSPVHRAAWFLEALPLYDHLFSPRRANLPDLERLGCPAVSYLPFAYAPTMHYPEPAASGGQQALEPDVVFVGGADRDRVRYVAALLREDLKVALYGGYWERFRETRAHALGYADPAGLRTAIGRAKIALCLVRRANRDGHCMRTFEVPAIGACMLTEDTAEHRAIFGGDGEAVVYFSAAADMLQKARWLLDHGEERRRLAEAAHRRIVGGANTYRDRLAAILQAAPAHPEPGVAVPRP